MRLVQPVEDTFSKTFGSMFAITMLTGNPYLALPALLFTRVIYSTNKAMYVDTAGLEEGADLLSELETRDVPPRWKSYVKDFSMWCSSAEKGITYAYGIYSLSGNPYMAVIAGIFSHRGDLLGEARLWSLRREEAGEPSYQETVGWLLDVTNCQCLPKSMRDYVAIDPIVTKAYPLYRSGIHTLAAYKGFEALGWSGVIPAFLALYFGGAEYHYSAGFNQKIMQHALRAAKQEAQGLSKLFNYIYSSRPGKAFTAVLSGRLLIDLFGIFLPPLFLNQAGKVLGSALMGAAAAHEMREQIPAFLQVFDNNLEFEIPASVYYSLMTFLMVVLFISGRQQVKAAGLRQLDGSEIGLQAVLKDEYGIKPATTTDLERPASRLSTTLRLESPLLSLDDRENPSNPAPITNFAPYCKNVSTRYFGLLDSLKACIFPKKPTPTAPVKKINMLSSGPQSTVSLH